MEEMYIKFGLRSELGLKGKGKGPIILLGRDRKKEKGIAFSDRWSMLSVIVVNR